MAVGAFVIAATVARSSCCAGRRGCREPDHGPHPLHPGRRCPRTLLAAALRGYMISCPARPHLTLSGRRDHPPGRLPRRRALGRAESSAALAAVPALIGAPLLLAILPSLLTQDSTLLRWAWPCRDGPGLRRSAVARSGFGAWLVAALPAPSSLRSRDPALPGPQRYHTVRRLGRDAASSLFVALALACSIPMCGPDPIQAPGESGRPAGIATRADSTKGPTDRSPPDVLSAGAGAVTPRSA